jgi:hypothetical protein
MWFASNWTARTKKFITGLLVWPMATWWAWRSPHSRAIRIAASFLGAIWLFTVLGAFSGNDSSQVGNQQALVQNNVSTADATSTPSATAAATVVVTSTKAPTPVATPECPTSADRIYFTGAAAPMGGIADASAALGRLFGQVGGRPSLLFSSDWKLAVVVQLAILKNSSDQIDKLRPTSGTAEIHRHMQTMASLNRSAVDDIANGIDNFDTALLSRAISGLNASTAESSTVTTLTKAFCSR